MHLYTHTPIHTHPRVIYLKIWNVCKLLWSTTQSDRKQQQNADVYMYINIYIIVQELSVLQSVQRLAYLAHNRNKYSRKQNNVNEERIQFQQIHVISTHYYKISTA